MRIQKIRLAGLALLCMLISGVLLPGSLPAFAQWTPISRSAHPERIVWPDHYFAPYSYDAVSQADLVTLAHATGTKFFTLAFISDSKGQNCRASWNGRQAIGPWMQSSISALRAIGGDVSVAFGSNELAGSCADVSSLQAQYRAVIEDYNLTHLDFDIEGSNLANTRANILRNRAIAGLQKAFAATGRRLVISYTLPTTIAGLTPAGISLLRDARRRGVHLTTVNIMTMNYYSQNAPGNQMGRDAIRTADNVFQQLHALYPARSAAQLWSMLGITPMIGVNRDTREIFSLRDARTLLNFAQQQHIAWLSFWSVQRDEKCSKGEVAPHLCTGVSQQPYQYARDFAGFGA
jgi:hypothetical protein